MCVRTDEFRKDETDRTVTKYAIWERALRWVVAGCDDIEAPLWRIGANLFWPLLPSRPYLQVSYALRHDLRVRAVVIYPASGEG